MTSYEQKCLYVKGLNPITTKDDLSRIFRRAGIVTNVNKLTDNTAIVVFKETASAKQAIELLNKSCVDGNTIHVSHKRSKKANLSKGSSASNSQASRQRSPSVESLTEVLAQSRNPSCSNSSVSDEDSGSLNQQPLGGNGEGYRGTSRRRRGRVRRGKPQGHVFHNSAERGSETNLQQLQLDNPLVEEHMRSEPSFTRGRGASRRGRGRRGQFGPRNGKGANRGTSQYSSGASCQDSAAQGENLHDSRTYSRSSSRQDENFNDPFDNGSDRSNRSASCSSSDSSDATETLFKLEQTTDLDKLRYLIARHMVYSLMKKMAIKIDVALKNSTIHLEGKKSKVLQAISEINDIIGEFFILSVPISEVFKLCFRTIKAGEIVEAFKRSRVSAGWDIRDSTLQFCTDSLQSANLAMDVIRELVTECEYPATGELSPREINCIATETRWRNLLMQLNSQYASQCLRIQFGASIKKVHFALRSSECQHAIIKALSDFFEPLKNVQHIVRVEPQIAKLISINTEQVLKQCCEDGVTLDFANLILLGCYTLTSQSVTSLQTAAAKHNKLIDRRVTKMKPSSKPGHIAWLKSAIGIAKLGDIKTLTKTVSATAYRSHVPRPIRPSRNLTRSPKWYRRVQTPSPNRQSLSPSSSQSTLAPASTTNRNRLPIMKYLKQLFPPKSTTAEEAANSFATSAVAATMVLIAAPVLNNPGITFSSFKAPSPTVSSDLLDKLQITMGDISTVQADALVSSQGVIARSIEGRCTWGVLLRGGLQAISMTRTANRISSTSTVSVYHLSTDSWNNTDAQLEKFVENVRKAYRSLSNAKILAFPVIGTGGLRYPSDKVAQIMIGTILECLQTVPSSSIKTVMIVMDPEASAVHQAFQEERAKYKAEIEEAAVVAPVFSCCERANVTFTGLKEENVDEAIRRLEGDLEHSMATTDWSNSPQRSAIQRLTQQEIDGIFKKAVDNSVKIEFILERENIKLEGLKDAVNGLRDEINHILHRKSSSTLPPHWDQTDQARDLYQVKVESYSAEFERVAEKFRGTCFTAGIHISEIMRIQNEELYTQYQAQKNKAARELAGSKSVEVEKALWHGTTAESTKQISAHGFNRSFAGKNGTAYGQGTYFSKTSNYSVRYSQGVMLLAKVVTGKYMLGNSSITAKTLSQHCHSTVDSSSNPTIFVVYHDAAAYPEYAIHFVISDL